MHRRPRHRLFELSILLVLLALGAPTACSDEGDAEDSPAGAGASGRGGSPAFHDGGGFHTDGTRVSRDGGPFSDGGPTIIDAGEIDAGEDDAGEDDGGG
jgi:hypothetical protein